MIFRSYQKEDYDLVIDFLVRINKNKEYINWNWARMEWMMFHPYFRDEDKGSIGLWFDDETLVAIAIYDMYFGEVSCLTLEGYEKLYQEVINYSYQRLQDENGLSINVNKNNRSNIKLLEQLGYKKIEQKETILSIDINKHFDDALREGYQYKEIDPVTDSYEFQYVLFQGFDHGEDKEEFEKEYVDIPANRPHFDKKLSLSIMTEDNKLIAYCSLWHLPGTDYAYLEPLCVIPSYRNKGLGKLLVNKLLNVVSSFDVKTVFVISDSPFYFKAGFSIHSEFYFYHKNRYLKVNDKEYEILSLLGKGKGGYSYLAQINNQKVVLKQIHHEPCDYYQFGNKIEAEQNDYHRLIKAGIRIPQMIDVDAANERIIKEFIDGETIFDMVKNDQDISLYIEQVKEMASLAKKAGLNIDYFPTNFVVNNSLLYYIDYECNEYMDEWNFDNWGIKYWSKSQDFLDYLKNK